MGQTDSRASSPISKIQKIEYKKQKYEMQEKETKSMFGISFSVLETETSISVTCCLVQGMGRCFSSHEVTISPSYASPQAYGNTLSYPP